MRRRLNDVHMLHGKQANSRFSLMRNTEIGGGKEDAAGITVAGWEAIVCFCGSEWNLKVFNFLEWLLCPSIRAQLQVKGTSSRTEYRKISSARSESTYLWHRSHCVRRRFVRETGKACLNHYLTCVIWIAILKES